MQSSNKTGKKVVLKIFVLFIGACLAMLSGGHRTSAASCINLADIPLDTLEQAAPGLIMFVLDDSGSMDWSTMTRPGSGESEGTFDGMEYVFHNPGDDVYGSREHIEDYTTHRMMWMSQWSGYNGMYYNPETEYTPWPDRGAADVDNPQSNPMNAGNTLDMTAVWDQLAVDNSETTRFATTGTWASGTATPVQYGPNYLYASGGVEDRTATWTDDNLNPAVVYNVFARWTGGGAGIRHTDVRYRTYDGSVDPLFPDTNKVDETGVDQNEDKGTWVQIATNVSFPSGTGIVQINENSDQSGLCADAVRFVPVDNSIADIMRRHYFVSNGNGTFLVNLRNGAFEYYRVTLNDPTNNRESATVGKLARLSDVDAAAAGIVTGRTYAVECQNFANWYSFYRRRELAAKNAIGKTIDTMDGVYVGIITIHERIMQPVLPVGVNLGGVLYDDSTILLNVLYGLNSNDGTPLRLGLKKAGEYFRGNYMKPNTFESHTSSETYPFFNSDKGGNCQQAFTILFTDGFYNGGSPDVSDADSDDDTNFDGAPFADGVGNTLADVAMYYFERDLNATLPNSVPITQVDPADHQHMVTFSIAFGVTGSLDTTLYSDCPMVPNACPNPWPGTGSDSGKIDDMFHAAVNGRGQFIAANNNEELVAALEVLGNDIDSRLGSAAALATNSIQRTVGSVVYQGTYNTAGWYGEVSALPLNLITGAVGAPIWRASGNVPPWQNRKILSYDGTTGILFEAASLSAAQVGQLEASGLGTAAEIVDFLRGDTARSVDNGGTLRNRNNTLGDVVHSAPIYFKDMVYIGANDGMLHGLRASTGEELFAYVPNLVYDHLSELAYQGYSHRYFVDGTASAAKVGSQDVLVCGLGKGGKGYFALDVTTPDAMNTGDVLWEYSAVGDDDLGYSFSRAFIVNTEAVGKVVIFGNGYDSVNQTAALYVLNPVTGSLIKKFDTGVAGCNGLATPAAVDVELDGNVDYAFAGDLKGNMWKFDLRGASVSDWKFSYQNGATPMPLVSVRNANDEIQPITAMPQVMLDCAYSDYERGLMVIFGTGKYLTTDDFDDYSVQSHYGIWDRGPTFEDSDGFDVAKTKYLGTFQADRSLSNLASGVTLLRQDFIVDNADYSALTDNQPDWYYEGTGTGSHVGWYWDMPEAGERGIRDPLLRQGFAVLISTIPSKSPCDAGGSSVIYQVSGCSGGNPYKFRFDVNGDGVIDDVDVIGDPYGNPITPSGKKISKILFNPLEVADQLYMPDSSGGIEGMPIVPDRPGMFFWRIIGQ